MTETSSITPLSAARFYSGPALWRTLRRVSLAAGRCSLGTVLELFYCLKDADTPAWAKGVIVGALGYLILPVDMVPDLLPGAGYGDDWGAIVAALSTVAACIKPEHRDKARMHVERLLGNCHVGQPDDFCE